jgi:cytoskeletal protein CcmA (bactofilin family)
MADVGVDDEVGSAGSVVFQVWADDVKLFDSGKMTGNSSTQSVKVDVTGKSQLKLVVTDSGNGIFADHADWAGAKLVSGDVPPPPPPPIGQQVALSTLTPLSASNGYGNYQKNATNDGRTIKLNGVTYDSGLGVHANSQLVYNLGGKYQWFMADVGVDDEVGSAGSVVFQVWADDVKLFDSGKMTGNSSTQSVKVEVTGKSQLKLVVTDSGNGIFADHADWAGAKLVSGDVPPPPPPPTGNTITKLTDLTPTSSTNGWGPVEKNQSVGNSGAGDGKTITLNHVIYSRGIGVHANSEQVFNLGGKYSRFFSDVGIDDEVGSDGSAIFQVWADDQLLFDSGVMAGNTRTERLRLNVAGRQQLRLVVNDAGDGINGDHGDWANAYLVG